METDRVKEILEASTDLNTIKDMDLLLERILYIARHFTNSDAGSIYTVEPGQKLLIRYAQNDTKSRENPDEKLIYTIFTVPISTKSISGYVAYTKEILNIPDMYTIPEDRPYKFYKGYDEETMYRSGSSLTIPLVTSQGVVLGVLQLLNAMDEQGNVIPFKSEDEPFIKHFASIATVALERAQMTRTLLLRMINMARFRDPKETGAHVNRVAGYSVEIYEAWAKRRNISEPEIEKTKDILRMAAMLHDVGKVGIPDTILKKPAKLTDREFMVMQKHTRIGAYLFAQKASEFDEMGIEIALRHHENWDGSGYPGHVDIKTGKPLKVDENGKILGLKGEEIPLFARIVSLGDVYDALSSVRSYKDAWPEEKVLAEIQRSRGLKFDPELVDIFFEVLPQLKRIKSMYKGN